MTIDMDMNNTKKELLVAIEGHEGLIKKLRSDISQLRIDYTEAITEFDKRGDIILRLEESIEEAYESKIDLHKQIADSNRDIKLLEETILNLDAVVDVVIRRSFFVSGKWIELRKSRDKWIELRVKKIEGQG